MRTILLYGGGIDSTALLHYLTHNGHTVTCLFVRYGQKAEYFEYESCAKYCAKYGAELVTVTVPFNQLTNSSITDDSVLSDNPQLNVLDGRNGTLAMLAAMLSARINAQYIALGYHVEPEGSAFLDAKPEFVNGLNQFLKVSVIHPVEVITPFITKTRLEIFKYALANDPDILNAHTCYEAVQGGCGKCSHCLLKAQLLNQIAEEKCVD